MTWNPPDASSAGFFMVGAMALKHPFTNGAADVTLAGSLLSSPAWAPWLAEFNELLSTATLVVGLILGLFRLWAAWSDYRKRSG